MGQPVDVQSPCATFNSQTLHVVWGGKIEGQAEHFFDTYGALTGQWVATLSEQLQLELLANAHAIAHWARGETGNWAIQRFLFNNLPPPSN